MTIEGEFVERIENPENPVLQDAFSTARQNTETRLESMGFNDPEPWLVRRLSYAYFYDRETDDPPFVFLLPDLGNVGQRFKSAVREFRADGPAQSYASAVTLYRHLVTEWLVYKNTDFSQQFLTALDEAGVIGIGGDWKEYVMGGGFFDDFYMTDVLKYRVGEYGKRQGAAAFREQVRYELEAIEPDIVFGYGGNVWRTVRDNLGPSLVAETEVDLSSIMEAHGHLFRAIEVDNCYVLPLAHMSGQVWWRFPPDEYVDRLERVLSNLGPNS